MIRLRAFLRCRSTSAAGSRSRLAANPGSRFSGRAFIYPADRIWILARYRFTIQCELPGFWCLENVTKLPPGACFFHAGECLQVGVGDWAPGGARGIYCTFRRFAGDSAARPAECSMHHAGDNSSQGGDAFAIARCLQARQSLYGNEARRSPASLSLCTFLC